MKSVTATDIGSVRRENQDMVRLDEFDGSIFAVVCDGMGGENSGAVASQMTIDTVFDIFSGAFYSAMKPNEIKELLTSAICEANAVVYDKSRKDKNSYGMGTTCVAALVTDDKIYIANVGDSRAYLIKDDNMTQITTDHSFVRMLFERGDIAEEEMQLHPQRNMLTKAVGVEKTLTPDCFEIDHHSESFKVILCSDGLSGYCTSDEILDIINHNGERIEDSSEELIKLAISKGGRDNVTLAIIAY